MGRKYCYVTHIIVRRYMMHDKTEIAAIRADVWQKHIKIYVSDRSHKRTADKDLHTIDHSKLDIRYGHKLLARGYGHA